jgi:chromosome segregation ATPase
MPISLDALTTLDLALVAAVAILSLVSGGLALRLQASPQASPPDDSQDHSDTLNTLQQQLKDAQSETKDAREEAELTLLQLHQVQEELEQIFLADQAKQEQIKNFDAKLKDAQSQSQQSQQQLKNTQAESQKLQQQLKDAQSETKDAREEAELTLLQLHQVQEELEHYFLLSREQNALLDGHTDQQKRVQKLLNIVISAQTHSASAEGAEA